MHRTFFVFRAFVLMGVLALFSNAALAQGWSQYVNREMQFEILFPGEPTVEEIEFPAPGGTAVPAHRYRATRGTGEYSMVIADFSDHPAEQDEIIAHAAAQVRAKGTARYDEFAQLNGIPGHALSIVQPDGRQILAQMYFWEGRLYMAEGSEAEGTAPPAHFSQSMVITHPDGTGVNINPGGATTREEVERIRAEQEAAGVDAE